MKTGRYPYILWEQSFFSVSQIELFLYVCIQKKKKKWIFQENLKVTSPLENNS